MTDAQPSLLEWREAEAAKEIVLDRLEDRRRAYVEKARAAARELYAIHGPVSVVDVRAVCPPPAEFDGRVMGAVFRKPEWRAVKQIASCRKVCHNRNVTLFERII